MMPEELEQDQQDTGWYYFIATPEIYPSLEGYVDQSRGYPIGGAKTSTLRGLPPSEDLKTTNDGSGKLMLQLETWRVSSDDLDALQPYIDQGVLSIITKAEWDELQIVEEEEMEMDEEEMDELEQLED